MEIELFLSECPGIPKGGIFKPKNCANVFMQKTHGFVITKSVSEPITKVSGGFVFLWLGHFDFRFLVLECMLAKLTGS